MKYLKLLLIALFTLSLCGCASSDDFTAPDYPIVEKPNETVSETVDGYRTPSSVDTEEQTAIVYYANKNSKKFHKPDCVYVKKMNDTSVLFEKDRTILIEKGYSPCSKCTP